MVGRGLLCPLCPLVPLSSTLCVSFVGNVCLLSFREALLFHLLGLSSMETVRRRLRLTRQPRYRVQGLLCPTAMTSRLQAPIIDRLWCFRMFHPLHLTQQYLNTAEKVSDKLSWAYPAWAVLTLPPPPSPNFSPLPTSTLWEICVWRRGSMTGTDLPS